MHNPTDAELVRRDERVARKLTNEIDDLRSRARDLREEAAQCERQAREIETSTRREEWWKLGWILDNEDIESLCNISPTDLLATE